MSGSDELLLTIWAIGIPIVTFVCMLCAKRQRGYVTVRDTRCALLIGLGWPIVVGVIPLLALAELIASVVSEFDNDVLWGKRPPEDKPPDLEEFRKSLEAYTNFKAEKKPDGPSPKP